MLDLKKIDLQFSGNNSLVDFNEIKNTENSLYIGFAGDLQKNIFTHKHPNSQLNSSYSTLFNNKELLDIKLTEHPTVFIHTVGEPRPYSAAPTTFFC
jgi:hypothetical protein